MACYTGKLEIVQILLSNEYINIDMASEPMGYTALMISIYQGYYEIVRILLEKGANLDTRTANGHSPLIFCFSRLENTNYKFENQTLCKLTIELLLQYGADLNIFVDNDLNNTILIKLVSTHLENEESFNYTNDIVKFLIERGANKFIKNAKGKSAMESVERGIYSYLIVKTLEETQQIYYLEKYESANRKSAAKKRPENKSLIIDDSVNRTNCCFIL